MKSPTASVLAAVLVSAALVALASPASAGSNISLTLHGGVSEQPGYEVWFVQGPTAEATANACTSNWANVGSGTPVKVRNEKGKTVGKGTLAWRATKIEDYHLIYGDIPADAPTRFTAQCVLEAKIPVAASSSYRIQISGVTQPGGKTAVREWTVTDKQVKKRKGKVDVNWR